MSKKKTSKQKKNTMKTVAKHTPDKVRKSAAVSASKPKPEKVLRAQETVPNIGGKSYGLIVHNLRQLVAEKFETATGFSPSLGQYEILKAVSAMPDTSQTGIVLTTSMDRSTVAEVVRRLAIGGLLERVRSKEDERAYCVRLKPAGQKLLDKGDAAMHQVSALIEGVDGFKSALNWATKVLQAHPMEKHQNAVKAQARRQAGTPVIYRTGPAGGLRTAAAKSQVSSVTDDSDSNGEDDYNPSAEELDADSDAASKASGTDASREQAA